MSVMWPDVLDSRYTVDISSAVGVSEQTVNNWRNRRTAPHCFQTIKALADFLGVSRSDLQFAIRRFRGEIPGAA